MPSDSYYDEIYDYVDRQTDKMREDLRQRLMKEFSVMSNEEKVNFLISKYIENKVSEIKYRR